ncbi:MAG: hypothetical protein QXK12_02150 [Candidatus Nezhaarchaeales archaeon]
MVLEFKREVKRAWMLNPVKGYEADYTVCEYRVDPLTGIETTVTGRFEYVKRFLVGDEEMVKGIVERSKPQCPFCPDQIEKATPKFLPNIIPEGRIMVGSAVAFPNIYAHAEHNVVITLTSEHYLQLNEFKAEHFVNGLKAGITCLERIVKTYGDVKHALVTMAYLPPAGATLIHPHIQVFAKSRPFYLTRLLMDKSREYYEANASNYWFDLVEAEKRINERYIAQIGSTEWLTPFAPINNLMEVLCIIPGKSNLLELNGEDLEGLALGLTNVLRFYFDLGLRSFNWVLLSGPLKEEVKSFSVILKVNGRTGPQPTCFNEAWVLPYAAWERYSVETPEATAVKLKPYFQYGPR